MASIANVAAIGGITRTAFFVHIAETEIALMAGKCVSCGGEMKVFSADEIIKIKNDLGMVADEGLEWWCDPCLRAGGIPTDEPQAACAVIPFPSNPAMKQGA